MSNWLLYLILAIAVVSGLAKFALEATEQVDSAIEKVVKEKPSDPRTQTINESISKNLEFLK